MFTGRVVTGGQLNMWGWFVVVEHEGQSLGVVPLVFGGRQQIRSWGILVCATWENHGG